MRSETSRHNYLSAFDTTKPFFLKILQKHAADLRTFLHASSPICLFKYEFNGEAPARKEADELFPRQVRPLLDYPLYPFLFTKIFGQGRDGPCSKGLRQPDAFQKNPDGKVTIALFRKDQSPAGGIGIVVEVPQFSDTGNCRLDHLGGGTLVTEFFFSSKEDTARLEMTESA